MDYKLEELLDIPTLRDLLDSLDEINSMPSAVLDIEGTILTATAWQDVCTKFHRLNPDIEKKCIESDTHIEADVAKSGSNTVYRCHMGLTDGATPIIIEGKHLGNVFVGQLFMEPPDLQYFVRQARQYGFDESEYLDVVRKVPIFSEEHLQKNLTFVGNLIQILAEQGLKIKRQLEAEEALSESRTKLKVIFDTSEAGIIVVSPEGVITFANRRIAEMFGVSPPELIGSPYSDHLHDSEKQVGVERMSQIVNGEIRSAELDRHYIRVDGTEFWGHLTGTRIDKEDGSMMDQVIVITDITERKLAEDKKAEDYARFKGIMDSLDSLVYVADMETHELLFINEYGIKLFGNIEGSVCWQTLQSGQSGPCACCTNDRLILENGEPAEVYVWEFQNTVNGRWYQCRDKAIRWHDNRLVRLENATDITERKRMENELLKSKQFLESVINCMPGIFYVIDSRGKFLRVNDKLLNVTGYSLDEVLRMNPLDLFPQLEKEKVAEKIGEVFDKGDSFVEALILSKDGKTTLYFLTGLYSRIDNESVLVGLGIDISESKRAEEEKQLLVEQLHQAKKMESLGVLAGGIAHDFNNILAVIICNCSLGMQRPKLAEELFPEIETSAQRAAGLCRQMLAYAGKTQFVESKVDVTTLVDEMLDMLKSTLPQNVIIKPYLTADIPCIPGDACQLRQLVMNMFINASEAIGEEQGHIRVALTETKINTITEKPEKDYTGKIITPGSYLCLEVTDSGCGMDDETKQKIFDPFYTTKFVGRGLGMSAVFGTIASHKGALQFSSQPSQGSTFKVYLPVANGDSATESLQQGSRASWRGSGTILLVEDEPQLMKVAKALLEELGFSVIGASNGIEAIEQYRKHAAEISLAVTDIGMPLMNGYQLIRELKKISPMLPIIVASGFGDENVTSKTAPGDIVGLISKPYSFDQLRDLLRSVLDNTGKKTEPS